MKPVNEMTRDEFNKMVGLRIQKARMEKWPRIPYFLKQTGLDDIKPDTYRKYESGAISLSLEVAWRIADALGKTLDDLVGRDFASKLVISDSLDPMERHILQRFRDLKAEEKIKAYNNIEYFIVSLEKGGPTEEEK